MVKRLPTMWETWVRSLGQEDPLEKEMATHSSILAWRIPWTEEPGGCSLWGRKKSDTSERLHFTSLLLHHYTSTILLSVYKENSKGLLFATDTYSYLSLTHTHPDTHTHTHTMLSGFFKPSDLFQSVKLGKHHVWMSLTCFSQELFLERSSHSFFSSVAHSEQIHPEKWAHEFLCCKSHQEACFFKSVFRITSQTQEPGP